MRIYLTGFAIFILLMAAMATFEAKPTELAKGVEVYCQDLCK